jgi:hypothetical protein
MLMFQITTFRNIFGNITFFAFFELFSHEHIEFESIVDGILFYF